VQYSRAKKQCGKAREFRSGISLIAFAFPNFSNWPLTAAGPRGMCAEHYPKYPQIGRVGSKDLHRTLTGQQPRLIREKFKSARRLAQLQDTPRCSKVTRKNASSWTAPAIWRFCSTAHRSPRQSMERTKATPRQSTQPQRIGRAIFFLLNRASRGSGSTVVSRKRYPTITASPLRASQGIPQTAVRDDPARAVRISLSGTP
jgi:hypothetical protein